MLLLSYSVGRARVELHGQKLMKSMTRSISTENVVAIKRACYASMDVSCTFINYSIKVSKLQGT